MRVIVSVSHAVVRHEIVNDVNREIGSHEVILLLGVMRLGVIMIYPMNMLSRRDFSHEM
jgi:hypothetical protein